MRPSVALRLMQAGIPPTLLLDLFGAPTWSSREIMVDERVAVARPSLLAAVRLPGAMPSLGV